MSVLSRIIGFTVQTDLSERAAKAQANTLRSVLKHFPWLEHFQLRTGNSQVDLWGYGQLTDYVYRLADGSLLILIGSPIGDTSWDRIEKHLTQLPDPTDFHLPWDGRVILLRISADGRHWTMWNDWAGSIPVFHTRIGKGRIASTLEPVIVGAADYTPNDFFLPGLVSLLINGHYLGNWTLFKDMNVVPPDCVAEWNAQGFRWKRLWTVKPSDERWDKNWDALVDEMYELSRRAISDVLKTQPSWILPLSGGLDSRLIAAVGTEMGVDLHAYTYGPPTWDETIYARQVAETLGLPWKRVDLGTDFLAKYTRMWADWFGSALHFHGMYQMPFLEAIKEENIPIVTGFIGDPLAGAQTAIMMSGEKASILQRLIKKWHMWLTEELCDLLRFDASGAVQEIHSELQRQYNEIPGQPYQRIWFIFWWNHVFGFSYYQPMMYDYWKGVATPYLNAEYGCFTLSLPRRALKHRQLQGDVFRRYYPKLAVIPGTYASKPLVLTGRYLVKRLIAELLPKPLRLGLLREFNPSPNTFDSDCMRATGRSAIWPIYEAWDCLSEWFNMDMIKEAIKAAQQGNLQAVLKVEALQPVAYRLLDNLFC